MSLYLKTKKMGYIQIDGISMLLFMLSIISGVAIMTIKIDDMALFQKMVIIVTFNIVGGFVIFTQGFKSSADPSINAFEFDKMITGIMAGLIFLIAASMAVPSLVPYSTIENKIMNILFMIAIATGEEFFFRYYAYLFALYLTGNVYIAGISQALIFALYHATSYTKMGFHSSALLVAFIAGLVFMWQDLYTRRLSTSMITHALWNTLPLILSLMG